MNTKHQPKLKRLLAGFQLFARTVVRTSGQPVHWDLEVSDDWVDPGLYTRLQELVASRAGGKKFFIIALGQDLLLCFGDAAMKTALSQLSSLEFKWE